MIKLAFILSYYETTTKRHEGSIVCSTEIMWLQKQSEKKIVKTPNGNV